MLLSYDPEGDLLEVVFNERLQSANKLAYRMRDGVVLYVGKKEFQPIQLTLINYWRLAQLPSVEFDGWLELSKSDRERLSAIVTSPAISAFLKFDLDSGFGHFTSPAMLEVFSAAA